VDAGGHALRATHDGAAGDTAHPAIPTSDQPPAMAKTKRRGTPRNMRRVPAIQKTGAVLPRERVGLAQRQAPAARLAVIRMTTPPLTKRTAHGMNTAVALASMAALPPEWDGTHARWADMVAAMRMSQTLAR
jgi:hypothetical protein